MKKFLKRILFNIIFFAILLEVVSIIYIKIKKPAIWGYDEIPTWLDFKFNDSYERLQDPLSPKVIDSSYPWCTWHPLNQTHRQVSDCFDVTLKFNSMGTRGPLPNPADSNTILFLGDSFVEGFGLQEDSTIAERMHQRLKKQVLNLGCSGSIGTTQMSLIYSGFAKQFSHKDVYVLFYLNNDFVDNDVNMHDREYKNRFRPYRILTNADSSKIIYKGSIDSTPFSWKEFYNEKEKGFTKLKKYGYKSYFKKGEGGFLSKLTKLTYSRRFLEMVKSIFRKNATGKSDELNFSATDWKILEIDIRSILETAAQQNARVTFINLPSKQLMTYSAKSEKKAKQYEETELKLKKLIGENGGRYLSFYDYLIGRKEKTDPVFFSCDNHYSNYGELLLSDFIFANYQNK